MPAIEINLSLSRCHLLFLALKLNEIFPKNSFNCTKISPKQFSVICFASQEWQNLKILDVSNWVKRMGIHLIIGRRYLYFNAVYLFYNYLKVFEKWFSEYSVTIRDNGPKEICLKNPALWLSQVTQSFVFVVLEIAEIPLLRAIFTHLLTITTDFNHYSLRTQ